MTDLAVETTELVKRFGPRTAVDHLNLLVEQGEIYGLVGPSGAGKTTVMRIVCGLTKPTAGVARLLGHAMPAERRAVEARLGYMPQERAVYRDLTVVENLLFFGQIYGLSRAAVAERTRELLDWTRMSDHAQQRADRLSGGEKQRLSLACSLVHDPKMLVLDEPTIGLDPGLRQEFWDRFQALNQGGRTIVLSTHYIHEAERCGRVGLMARGNLVAEGRAEDLKARVAASSGIPSPDMDQVFLVLTRAATAQGDKP
jgi:ABC-2 type transport system ATP-binding protein